MKLRQLSSLEKSMQTLARLFLLLQFIQATDEPPDLREEHSEEVSGTEPGWAVARRLKAIEDLEAE